MVTEVQNQDEVKSVSSDEEKVRTESRKTIVALNQKNKELLNRKQNRLGWYVGYDDGRDESEVFILAQPIDVEVPSFNEARQETDELTYRYYIMFTRFGIRAIWLNKGAMDEPTAKEYGGFDNRYDGGERYLLNALTVGQESWEDETGNFRPRDYWVRVISKPSFPVTPSSPEARLRSMYKSLFPGFTRSDDGRESFKIKGDNNSASYYCDSTSTNIYGIVNNFPEEMVTQAYEKSLNRAETKREIPEKPEEKQIRMLEALQKSLLPE